MGKVNRNDPCPCGSGKKYKKCCLTADDNLDFRNRRWQRVETGLIPRLMHFAFNSFGAEVFDDAWKDFTDDEIEDKFDPEHPMNVVFIPWCFFSWRPDFNPVGSTDYFESTLAELFIQENENSLTSDERRLLQNYVGCPFSLCEIVGVNPGVGMTQFDLFRRVKYDVIERTASRSLKRGELIYCATTELNGISFNFGTSPIALRPIEKHEILRFRKWMSDQIERETITNDDLKEFADDIRGLYLDIMSDMFAPPGVTTTDGDSWVPHKIHFELKSADKAFQQLKDLAEGVSESDLLADAVIENGQVTRTEIPWLGGKAEARTRMGGPVLLGLLKIDGKHLVAEVNSVSRAELLKTLIKGRCKGNATHKSTLIEPIESAVEEMWHAAGAGQSFSGSATRSQGPSGMKFKTTFRPDQKEFFDSSENDSDNWTQEENDAELRAFMEAAAKRHWETWFDLPVPALNDLTPREAAKTEEGRDLLESLLLYYENLSSPDEPVNPNIPELRRKLGIE